MNQNQTTKKMQNSPIGWLGGKRLLRKEIISRIPSHRCYVEAFAGGASVLFAKEPSKVEVLNDLNDELINFFQVVKTAPEELFTALQYELVSRKRYEQFKSETQPKSNLERAMRFFYVLKASFGGLRRPYGYSRTHPPKLNFTTVREVIDRAHRRLLRVNIEHLDYRDIIDRYDGDDTFFYLDPPYRVKSAKEYIAYFQDQDFRDFRKVLDQVRGKFLLSLNDDPFIRDVFSGYEFETLETTYSLSRSGNKKVQELLFRNF